MKINKIKINSYGKLKEKEIKLKDGINIIYGKNESGKSTLLNFIVNSFYGISKNKKGKEYSDVEKYTPWLGEEFSGKLEYELNNKNKYEIYRDFKKKNPKIFNENMEDISKEFNIDKSKGNEFFYEQTKVDEELFLSTVVVGQQEVKLGKQEQNILVQKIANLVGTGDDNVSYKRAIDRINRRLLDEIGTQRSREKPINIINKKIEDLEQKKQELEKYEDIKYEIEENKNKLEEEISDLNNKNNLLKEIKIINEKEKIEKEKIKIKENIKKENIEKIKLIKEKINKIKNENKNIFEINNEKTKNNKKINNEKNKLNKKIIIVFIFLLIINFLQFIFIKNKLINYIFLLTVPMTLIYFIISKNKLNKKIKKQKNIDENNLKNIEKINLEINNLNNEINLLEKNNNNLEKEINNLKSNLNLKINLEKEKIKNKYLNKIEKSEIINFINLENINYEIEKLQNEINNKKIRSHTLELDQKNIEPKLDNLSKIEEELVNNNERMSTLNKLNLSFELAKEILAESYEEMRNTVTPKFTQELSKNISEITEKKYSKIMFNDEQGLIVELESGNYVPASKLSIGTIDQLYLSLRLSMIDELSEENLPIILDEAFAYYDTERLTNILKYLDEKYKTHQIILFTCTNREKEILEKIKVPYNLIEL
ncbi:MAG TPA: AAA family ATPase [Clostridiaceae bacterium]|nr:AAA family ATPase [Clostridiaceae bacterium]